VVIDYTKSRIHPGKKMPEQALLATEQLDYRFLLIIHMVCADQQIHSEEAKSLHQLRQHIKIGQHTIAEMEKILSQDEQMLSVEYIARQLPASEQGEAMRQILAIAYIDGFFSPLEREMAEQVVEIWNWSKGEILQLIKDAAASHTIENYNDNKKQAELSLGARLLQGADSVLSPVLVDSFAKIASEKVGRKLEELRREILLAGPEYDEAIQRCATIATDDYKYAEFALKNTGTAMYNLGKGIQDQLEAIQRKTSGKGKAQTATEVAKQLENTRKYLTAEILKEIESVRKSIPAKQRALNHFSIAFMGKTKAGKSTLHAIITGGGWDAIGVGKQRTTRLNRVYEWKNIRIIDTPGIGAPGGKTDEEIAQSVIEESDIICYVVTNDSIQETEFQFLKLLKEKAKPLIILLNVKNNLRDSRRLEHFLKDPDKAFAIDGQSGLGGHIERIHRYAKQHYTNDYFDIVPVMLLAAQMSREPEHKERKEKLFKASHIQNFLDSIRMSLVKYGVIRRSQTLLGSTVGAIEKPNQWVTQQAQIYRQLTDTLKSQQENSRKDIQKAASDNISSLEQQIKAIFQDAFNVIPSFAEDHWDKNEISLKIGWEGQLKNIRFEDRLKTAFEESSKNFNQDVKEILQEVGNELQLVAKLNAESFIFNQQDAINFRYLFRIGSNILLVASAVLTFFAPPIGIALGIIGTFVNLITGFFKSNQQKRREAVENISKSLENQLKTYQENALAQAKEDFGKYCNDVAQSINTYFEELIQGLEVITEQLARAKCKLDETSNYLNRAYAKRIIDWCCNKSEPLTDEAIYQTIIKVKRDFGRGMNIQTKIPLKLSKSSDEIKQVLQEDVVINSTT